MIEQEKEKKIIKKLEREERKKKQEAQKEQQKQEEIEREIARQSRFRFFNDDSQGNNPKKSIIVSKSSRINCDLVSQISEVSDSQMFTGVKRKQSKIYLDKVESHRSKFSKIDTKFQKPFQTNRTNEYSELNSSNISPLINKPGSAAKAQSMSLVKNLVNYPKIKERVIKLKKLINPGEQWTCQLRVNSIFLPYIHRSQNQSG